MKINATSTPVWQELTLNDAGVTKFVIPAWLVDNFEKDTKMPVEYSGFLTGVLHQNTFYVVGSNPLCSGRAKPMWEVEERTVGLEPEVRGHGWVFQEECTRRFAELMDGVRTVLWHSHVNTGEDNLYSIWPDEAEPYISVLQDEISEGAFDYLIVDGRRPSMDVVVNEVISRILSPADIKFTPGNTHLLITDTFRVGHPVSHLNAYKLQPQKAVLGKLPVSLETELDTATLSWYNRTFRLFEIAHRKTCIRHGRVTREIEKVVDFPFIHRHPERFYIE